MREFKVGDKVKCTGLSCFGKDLAGKSGGITDFTTFSDEQVTVAIVFVPKLDNYFLVRFSDMKLIKPHKVTRKQLKQRIKELEAQLMDPMDYQEMLGFEVDELVAVKKGAEHIKKGTTVEILALGQEYVNVRLDCILNLKYLEKL